MKLGVQPLQAELLCVSQQQQAVTKEGGGVGEGCRVWVSPFPALVAWVLSLSPSHYPGCTPPCTVPSALHLGALAQNPCHLHTPPAVHLAGGGAQPWFLEFGRLLIVLFCPWAIRVTPAWRQLVNYYY